MSSFAWTPCDMDPVTHESLQYLPEPNSKESAAATAASQEIMGETLSRMLDHRMEIALLLMAEIVENPLDEQAAVVEEVLHTLRTRTEGLTLLRILK